MMMNETALSFKVTGLVQGVGFRAFVQRTARELGLAGWAKNDYDGSVIGVCQGPEGMLREFLAQVKLGNRWSDVKQLQTAPAAFDPGLTDFVIRY